MSALRNAQTNPQETMKLMTDPSIGPKIQKLIAAGIIKTR